MSHPECMYCAADERQAKLMIEIAPLSVSTLYLFREQTYRGRVLVALNHHEREMFLLPEDTRNALMADVAKAAQAVEQAFKPGKINYGAYGDTMPHVHFHIVPKYEGGEQWGSTFVMNPAQVYLSDEEYAGLIEQIRAQL
ncbi:MAG: histidine triad protein [Paenibacillaceae bacterium]|nr:histidine triad protein [Paenibacillaceae bacterium]